MHDTDIDQHIADLLAEQEQRVAEHHQASAQQVEEFIDNTLSQGIPADQLDLYQPPEPHAADWVEVGHISDEGLLSGAVMDSDDDESLTGTLLPRTRAQRERDAWTKTELGKTVPEQWVLELIRNGRRDRIEEFIRQVADGKETLPSPSRDFVLWRSRGLIDPDIATTAGTALQYELADIWREENHAELVQRPQPAPLEASIETSQFPHLEKLGLKR